MTPVTDTSQWSACDLPSLTLGWGTRLEQILPLIRLMHLKRSYQ